MLRSALPPSGVAPRSERSGRDAVDRVFVARARDGGPRERAEAVVRFGALTRHLARRYGGGMEPMDDLEQVAVVGLLKAIDGFDLQRETAFAGYAVPTITGELRRHFRDLGWAVRPPRHLQELTVALPRVQDALSVDLGRQPTPAEVASVLKTSVERVLEAREASSALRPVSLDRPLDPSAGVEGVEVIDSLATEEEGFARVEGLASIAPTLRRLPLPEREAVVLRFSYELSQSEIAERLGVSQMQVSRLLSKALATLGEIVEEDRRHASDAPGRGAAR